MNALHVRLYSKFSTATATTTKISDHIIDCHIKKYFGKSTFVDKALAIQVIRMTLDSAGGEKCLKTFYPFTTGHDENGMPCIGCKLVIRGNGWIVTIQYNFHHNIKNNKTGKCNLVSVFSHFSHF